ncbi:MAG: entericidin A/B family lipoprotein [Candidatus Hydrogenedentes bacterium]|nr:entericidin A/B family lipoprotein [Candidatus Hydrogenedentota bacterium]
MKRIIATLSLILAVAILGACLNGCNTFRGIGKDIQAGGRAIERAANK